MADCLASLRGRSLRERACREKADLTFAVRLLTRRLKKKTTTGNRSVTLAIKRYEALEEPSNSGLDDLIDIVRRKINDGEKRQSKIKLEQYKNLRG